MLKIEELFEMFKHCPEFILADSYNWYKVENYLHNTNTKPHTLDEWIYICKKFYDVETIIQQNLEFVNNNNMFIN